VYLEALVITKVDFYIYYAFTCIFGVVSYLIFYFAFDLKPETKEVDSKVEVELFIEAKPKETSANV
jgi:hypothetical protein